MFITQTIFIYCLCDEIVQSLAIKDDAQCKMTTAEVMTFVLLSSIHYKCNYQTTRHVIMANRFFSKMLSYSRLIRRIHAIPEKAWIVALQVCQQFLTTKNNRFYIVDSFPVPVCQNNKIFRCKLLQGKSYHGYTASKKRYFWGIKVHMIVDLQGTPIEFLFTPGSESDIRAFKRFNIDLPASSKILADRAYNDYEYEDLLKEISDIQIVPKRKKNSKRSNDKYDDYFLYRFRNRIETVFSCISGLMSKCIKATTQKGFFLKIFFAILGYTVKKTEANRLVR